MRNKIVIQKWSKLLYFVWTNGFYMCNIKGETVLFQAELFLLQKKGPAIYFLFYIINSFVPEIYPEWKILFLRNSLVSCFILRQTSKCTE